MRRCRWRKFPWGRRLLVRLGSGRRWQIGHEGRRECAEGGQEEDGHSPCSERANEENDAVSALAILIVLGFHQGHTTRRRAHGHRCKKNDTRRQGPRCSGKKRRAVGKTGQTEGQENWTNGTKRDSRRDRHGGGPCRRFLSFTHFFHTATSFL